MVARTMPFIGDYHPKLNTVEWLRHTLEDVLFRTSVPALFLVT